MDSDLQRRLKEVQATSKGVKFRKLSLYPVELRPRFSIVILPAFFSSA